MPSDAAAAGACASSSDEDTSDEAFAARHAGLEAEEQQRFNSFAGEPAFAHCLSASWLVAIAVIGFSDFAAAQRDIWRVIPTQAVEHCSAQAHFCHSFSVRRRCLDNFCYALNDRRHGMTLLHVSAVVGDEHHKCTREEQCSMGNLPPCGASLQLTYICFHNVPNLLPHRLRGIAVVRSSTL